MTQKRYRRDLTPEDIEQRGKRIKYLRKLLRYSARVFSEKCQTKESTLKSWEQGQHTGLTTDGALRIVTACKHEGVMHCTLEWLLYGQGIMPELSSRLPLTAPATAIMQELSFFHQLHPNAIDTIVADMTMEPCFAQGDHVAGLRCFGDDIAKLIGLNCIAQLNSGEILVRKLLAGETAGHYALACLSEGERPVFKNVALFSAAYIIWVRKPALTV